MQPRKLPMILVVLILSWLNSTPLRAEMPSPEWHEKMTAMKTVFVDLVPYIFDRKRFEDPKNFTQIESKTAELATLAKDLNQHQSHLKVATPDPDPGIEFMSFVLHDKIERAHQSLKLHQLGYAQNLLRTATAACITCHTRSEMGPQFSYLRMEPQIKALHPSDRMSLLAATRQFDAALKEYRKQIAPTAKGLELEQSSRIALATAVRVKQNPEQALQVISELNRAPGASTEFKKTAEEWKKALLAWKKEKPGSADELVTKAKSLVEQAQKTQRFPADARGDVQYMRASALLHDYLRENPKGARSGEALYLIGQCYEILRDLGFWGMYEIYYEACIRQAPQSGQAMQCYKRIEDSVTFGYTGSRGTFIPPEAQKHLAELKAQADDSQATPKK